MTAYVLPPVNAQAIGTTDVPYGIAEAMLVSTTVAETEHTEWVAATAYANLQRVRRTTAAVHRVFERQGAGTTPTPPEADPLNWLDVSATNRWAMFDMLTEAGTSGAASPLTFSLQPGTVTALVLRGIEADTVTVAMTSGVTTVYSYTADLDGSLIDGWDDYFFAPFATRELIPLFDLPSFDDGVITVTLTRASGTIRLDKCIVGTAVPLGETQFGARVRRTNFSKIERTAFGNLAKLRRLKSVKRVSQVCLARTDQLEAAAAALDLAYSCPAFFLGVQTPGTFQNLLSLVAVVLDHDVSPENPKESPINMELEGV